MRYGSIGVAAWVVVAVACTEVNSGTKAVDSAETTALPEVSEEAAGEVAEVTSGVETVDASEQAEASEVVALVRCDCGYGQDCASPCEIEGTVCVRDVEMDSRSCEPPARLGERCGNYDRAFSDPCEVELTCSFPLPDDADSAMYCYDCRPQDFAIVGNCEAEIGVFWDGADCALYSGCSCEGTACATPFETVAQCRSRTQTPCAPF